MVIANYIHYGSGLTSPTFRTLQRAIARDACYGVQWRRAGVKVFHNVEAVKRLRCYFRA